MSEFKFTCPVCGQHIAVDTGAAGAQIECPTCFQRIIVPQAPRADSKYILTATQYIKPQPDAPPAPPPHTGGASRKKLTSAILVSVIFIGLLAAGLYLLTDKGSDSDAAQPAAGPAGPTNADRVWSLNLGDALFPGSTASGKIHDREFICQRAILQSSALALSQNSGSSELAVDVYLPTGGDPGQEGRSFDVRTNHAGARPRITLRWREGSLHGSQTFSNGYAMKLELAQSAADKAPGKIYLCLPDDSQSFVAGTFDAEIGKALSPKLRQQQGR